MKRSNSKLALTLSVVLCFGLLVSTALASQSGLSIPEQVTGDRAWEHVTYFSEVVDARPTESDQEAMTQDYIILQFEALGYVCTVVV